MNMLEGKWKGKYTYGKGYGKGLAGRVVEFVIDLTINGDEVKGYCQDIGEIEEAFEKPAVIEGQFIQGKIVFTKRYPSRLDIDEKNIYVYSDLPSADIIYQGVLKTKLISRKKFFVGTWKIKSQSYTEDDKEVLVEYQGTWKMEKEL
jgi:hypothetical protein